jgi:hypothetical protein
MTQEKKRAYWRKQHAKHCVHRIAVGKKYYQDHREEILERSKRNRKKLRENQRLWRNKNPNYNKEYRNKNRDKIVAANSRWYKRNIDRERAKGRVRAKLRRFIYAGDAGYAIECRLRSRILGALRDQGVKKSSKTEALLGCTIAFAKKHIESHFLPGMPWGNRSKWHIDHIKPCVRFDLTDPAQQLECFHFTNLQPLWEHDNLSKHDKWPEQLKAA